MTPQSQIPDFDTFVRERRAPPPDSLRVVTPRPMRRRESSPPPQAPVSVPPVDARGAAPRHPHGAYDSLTEGSWSIGDAPKVKDWFRSTYNRELPVTAEGQSGTHNWMGLNHSDSMDVGLNPTTEEGRAFVSHLRESGIPFLAYDKTVPGAATAAHIHVGFPSRRGSPPPALASEPPDFDTFVASRNVPDFDEFVARRAQDAGEEVVGTEAAVEGATGARLALDDPRRRQRVDASTVQPSLPPHSYLSPPSPSRPDVRTTEGRRERDTQKALLRTPGARFDVTIPVSHIEDVDAGESLRDYYKSAALAEGVPAEYFDKWQRENNPHGYYVHDGRGNELTAADVYDDGAKGLRLSVDANHIAQIVDDYKASRGSLQSLSDWATSDETSPGEKFVDVASAGASAAAPVVKAGARGLDLATRPLQAVDAAFWARLRGANELQTVVTAYQQFFGDNPELGKNVIAEALRNSDRLKAINPRLPSLLGELSNVILQPSNLIPVGAVGRLAQTGKLARAGEVLTEGARGLRLLDRGLVESRPLGLLEGVAKDAAPAADDLLRSAGYKVERTASPNRAAGGEAPEVWKVTGPDGNTNILRDDAELADFAEGFAQSAHETRGASNVVALSEARSRYDRAVQESANAPNKLARENAQALADDYAKEIARLEGAEGVAGADGIDVHHSRFQPRTGAGQFDGPPAPRWKRAVSNAKAAIQLPKIKAGWDLSATGRQGLAQVAAHPSYLKEAFTHQVKAFASEDAFNAFRSEIMGRADFQQMKDAGLFLSSVGPEAEEVFASKLARRIPGVRGSDRAYSAALDSIRTQAWDSYTASLPAHLKNNPDTLKAVADLINISTGRGVVPILDRTAFGKKVIDALNVPFFSPRNTAAKFNLISPVRLARNMLDPATRPVAYLQLRDATQGLAAFGTTLGLLHVAKSHGAPIDVGLDPRSSDFGKLRVGKAVYDLTGGEGYTVRYLASMADAVRTGKADDPRRGAEALTRRYLRTQLQPATSAAADWWAGTTIEGKPVTSTSAALDLITPFVVEDVVKGFQAEGWLGAAKATPGVLGVGVSFYDKPKRGRSGGGN